MEQASATFRSRALGDTGDEEEQGTLSLQSYWQPALGQTLVGVPPCHRFTMTDD